MLTCSVRLNALTRYLIKGSDDADIRPVFNGCLCLGAKVFRGELHRRHRGRHAAPRARIPEQRKDYESPHRHLHTNLSDRIRVFQIDLVRNCRIRRPTAQGSPMVR